MRGRPLQRGSTQFSNLFVLRQQVSRAQRLQQEAHLQDLRPNLVLPQQHQMEPHHRVQQKSPNHSAHLHCGQAEQVVRYGGHHLWNLSLHECWPAASPSLPVMPPKNLRGMPADCCKPSQASLSHAPHFRYVRSPRVHLRCAHTVEEPSNPNILHLPHIAPTNMRRASKRIRLQR